MLLDLDNLTEDIFDNENTDLEHGKGKKIGLRLISCLTDTYPQ